MMTQLLKSRLPMVKSGLGLDRTLLIEEGSMHRKPSIPRYPSVLRRQYPPELAHYCDALSLHPGRVREHLDVTVHVGRELIKRAQTTQYIPIVTLARVTPPICYRDRRARSGRDPVTKIATSSRNHSSVGRLVWCTRKKRSLIQASGAPLLVGEVDLVALDHIEPDLVPERGLP
jgi:hypothetical protein